MTSARNDAEAALQVVQSANAEMARRARAPVWFHPVLGLLVGGLLAVQAAPLPVRTVYLAFYGLGLVLLVQAYRKRTGVWVSGMRRGRTKVVTVAGLGATLVVGAVTVWGALHQDVQWAWFAGGAVLTVVVWVTSVLWEVVYRAEMRGTR